MERMIQIARASLPEGFPTEIETPPYFLQVFDSPEWLWFFRVAIIVAVIVIIYGCSYYEKKAEKRCDEKNAEQQDENGGKE